VPKAGGRVAITLNDDALVLHDSNVLCIKACFESVVAEFSDGQEGTVGKGRNNVGLASGKVKGCDVEFSAWVEMMLLPSGS
jgi:hypothetical protein